MSNEVIEELLTYIDNHIQEKITLVEMAEIAGYSPFYFSKLFSEMMGMPITGYIRIRKLQYALASLLEGRKVLEVSLMYAFDSHEGFTRSFTQLFGTPPGKVRKYLTSYQVPPLYVPNIDERSIYMGVEKSCLKENMHQIVFEVLRMSFEEAEEGYCTEINIILYEDGSVRITDNGRGIPLSHNAKKNQSVLDRILAGHPISGLEYAQMGDFTQCGMQTVNSLCESLQINVFRDGMCFSQDYVRGIAQHDVVNQISNHPTGTEIILKPDRMIFGEEMLEPDTINTWIIQNNSLDISISIITYLTNNAICCTMNEKI